MISVVFYCFIYLFFKGRMQTLRPIQSEEFHVKLIYRSCLKGEKCQHFIHPWKTQCFHDNQPRMITEYINASNYRFLKKQHIFGNTWNIPGYALNLPAF